VSTVETEVREGVAWVALNRPEKLNAIDGSVLDGLLAAVARVRDDAAIGAAVLHGRGRAFSAGGDITAMAAMDEPAFAATIARYMEVAAAFRGCPKPIVAAVHGHALAGGFELALLCDVRVAADDAVFGLPDTPLGLSPTSGMTYLLPRIVGLGRALDLALLAQNVDAHEAERIGLVTRVVAPERLLEEAGRCAARIAGFPRLGVARTKERLVGALDATFAEATAAEAAAEVECFRDPEVVANLRGFAERRRR
jgi:2-(1,2-epoxy-1,2-dihydrophenyl)acetyl-CoA isomerase